MKNQFGFTFSKQSWTARRKAKRLKNRQIAEVSSVDRGAGEGCDVLLMKRDIRETKMRQSHEPFALEAPELEKAKRVLRAMDLDKLFKAHNAGQVDGAEFSDILRGLAAASYPRSAQLPPAAAKLFHNS
jgi:hypothetical protein